MIQVAKQSLLGSASTGPDLANVAALTRSMEELTAIGKEVSHYLPPTRFQTPLGDPPPFASFFSYFQ